MTRGWDTHTRKGYCSSFGIFHKSLYKKKVAEGNRFWYVMLCRYDADMAVDDKWWLREEIAEGLEGEEVDEKKND